MKAREIRMLGFWIHQDYPEVHQGGNVEIKQVQFLPTTQEFNDMILSGEISKYKIVLVDRKAEEKRSLDKQTTVYYEWNGKQNDLDDE